MKYLKVFSHSKLIDYINKITFLFCLIFIFYIFLSNKDHIFDLYANVSLKVIFIIILIGVLRCYIEGNILFSFIKKFYNLIYFFDFLNIYIKSSLTNHAIPHYGTIYGSLILKKKGLNYVDYIFCLSLLKLIRMVFSFLFAGILFLIFLRDYIYIDNKFYLIIIFIIGLFFSLVTLSIVIKLLKKNKGFLKFFNYLKKSFHKQLNFKIYIYVFLIIFIEFLIFYLLFKSISMETLNLLLIVYIFRNVATYIPIIQISTVHVATLTILSSIAGLNFVDSFLINLSTTLVGIISLSISFLTNSFYVYKNRNLKKNHG